jgi:hypothetical protein
MHLRHHAACRDSYLLQYPLRILCSPLHHQSNALSVVLLAMGDETLLNVVSIVRLRVPAGGSNADASLAWSG